MKLTPPRSTLTGVGTAESSSTAERLTASASRPSARVRCEYKFSASPGARQPSSIPTRRGTESVPQSLPTFGVRETRVAFAGFVDGARVWANKVLSRDGIKQEQVASLRGDLERLILSLDELERQLKRRDTHGLRAGEAMKLFYMTLAIRNEEAVRGDRAPVDHLRDVALQIRTALLRSVESSENC